MNQSTSHSTSKTLNPIPMSVPISNRHTFCWRAAIAFSVGLGLALTLASSVNAQEKSGELIEYWKGSLDYDGVELEMGLKVFRDADGALSGKFSSYSQGAIDLPVEFEKDGKSYKMKLPAANLEFLGTLHESQGRILGTIKQGSREDKLELKRADFDGAPKYKRPQTPQAPFPYESEEVTFTNSKHDIQLAGTLTLPPGDGPFSAAITISGSGASVRDGTHFEHKPYLVLADHLTRQGIAVLSFDDRGAGESTGQYSGATSADLATDVEAGIEFLKNHAKIATNKIGLIGHSEGGLIAPMIAADRGDVHFIVLLAGTGVNGGVILNSQSTAMLAADGASAEKLEANRKAHDAILSLIEKKPDSTHEEIETAGKEFVNSIEDETSRQLMEPTVKKLVALLKSKWVSFFVRYEPAKTLTKVNCHVLAMNGEKDLQVLCDLNLIPLEEALKKGSPASFKVVRLSNTNHMFQETNGSGTPSDYGKIEETFSTKALKIISDWVTKVTKQQSFLRRINSSK